MAEFTASTPGGVNQSTPNADESLNRAQFLVRYLGLVFATYKDEVKYASKISKKTLAKGAKSHIFYFTGIKQPKFLARGEESKGESLHFASKTIELDDLMYCDSFVADVDEHMSVLDVINEHAREDGIAIAKEVDIQVSIMITKSASENFPVTNPDGTTRDGGTVATLAAIGDELIAEKLVAGIKGLALAMDQKNVPKAGRYLFMKPEYYYVLVEAEKIISSDYSSNNGDYAKGIVKGVAGFEIVQSNLLVDEDTATWKAPNGSDDKYTNMQVKYKHDCTNVIMQAFRAEAVGMVMGREIKVEKGRQPRAQGEFIMTTIFKGIDTLNPVNAAILKKKTA